MNGPLDSERHTDFIRRVRGGDEQAAEELVRLYEPEIRREIRGWLRLRDPRLRRIFDSMDICQSVLASFFVRAAVGQFDLHEPRQIVQLLVAMARNKLAQQVRFHKRQRRDIRRSEGNEPLPGWAVAPQETPSQLVSRRELLEMVRTRLSTDERQVADLRARGYDWSAVAAELGGTSEGRRKQLDRAIDRVERELGLNSIAG
jgi:RNA polymerase sigma-70 factor (ECF subfamily)